MIFELFVGLISFYVIFSYLFDKKYFINHRQDLFTNYLYHEPGLFYQLKFAIAKLFLSSQQKQLKRQFELKPAEFSKGFIPNSNAIRLESPKKLNEFGEEANDAIAFQGSDDDGNQILIRFARRSNNLAEIWLVFRLFDKTSNESTLYVHPEHPNGIVSGLVDDQWNAKGLVCQLLEPMRRWRVSYNGLMRKGCRNDLTNIDNDLVHMKFEFYWTALSEPFHFNYQMHPNLIADALAREKWTKSFFENLQKGHEDRYEQWGQLTGNVRVDKNEIQLVLKGMRDHCYGERNWNKYARYTANMGYTEEGTFFHVGAVSMPESTTHLTYGYVGLNDGTLIPISQTSLNLALLGDIQKSPNEFTVSFQAGGKSYLLRATVEDHLSVYNGMSWESHSNLRFIKFELNDCPGTGFSEFEYKNEKRPPSEIFRIRSEFVPLPRYDLQRLNDLERNFFVVPLSHRACLCPDLVGGKAHQLAQLHNLQGNFTVPDAICVTIHGFCMFVQNNQFDVIIEDLRTTILTETNFKSNDWRQKSNNLREKMLKDGIIPESVTSAVIQQLHRIYFGKDEETVSFAVRSSALDEDGNTTSFAGQLDTVLNVKGRESLFNAIKKVWSSNFSEECLTYRKRNGLSLVPNVAVLIQEMVEADVAGVMFTCDPMTCHPGKIVINACPGIGEAVVDGTVKPITVIASKSYSGKIIDDQLEDESHCLTKEQIEKLATVGILIERCYSSPRDIEWAIKDNELFLLQARPVTTLDNDSDFTLMHEFDNSVGGINEYSTTHNVGEVMGGVNTPLGCSVSLYAIEKTLQYQLLLNGLNTSVQTNVFQSILLHANHLALKLTQCVYKDPLGIENRQVSELCLLGKSLEDSNLDEILKKKFKNHPRWKKIIHFCRVMRMLITTSIKQKGMMEKYKNLELIVPENQTCSQLLSAIENFFPYLADVWHFHQGTSGFSAVWYHVLMQNIVKEKKLTAENYMDIATIYSSCNDVESADIPAALQTLAKAVSERIDSKTFSSMSTEEAKEWILSKESGSANVSYKNFLRQHGHRCLKEIDFQAKSWSEDPSSLLETIQSLVSVGTVRETNSSTSVEEALNKISFRFSYFQKLFLLWAIPKARSAVGNRECSKSLAIKVTHAFRLGYRKLAQKLTLEGKIPDEDLIYYFTAYELRSLVDQNANATLVLKAQRRRKIKKLQEEVVLPEIIIGYPKIGNNDSKLNLVHLENATLVKGTPVSAGKVKGIVRVCKTLHDAKNIQSNEILVTHSTDIAWSVYFPIISGIITELGGLLSHGAVVAREYGIPCLVSANDATKIFTTGDIILLDCHNGFASKVQNE